MPYLTENMCKVQTKSDYVFEFCNLAPNDYDCWCVYEKDAEISVKDFKKIIEKYVWKNHSGRKYSYTHNKNALKTLGYDTLRKRLCGYCGKEPTGKRKPSDYCCSKYSSRNRKEKLYIKHLKIISRNCFECDSD